MKGLRKRGQTWWMSLNIDGRQIQRSTGTKDKKLAKKIYLKVQAEISEGRWFERPVGADKTFDELMEKYYQEVSSKKSPRTHERDSSLANHLVKFFGGFTLIKISPKLVSAYKVQRRGRGAAPQTINNELGLMSHAFNVAMKEWEWVSDNPVSKVSREKVDNRRDRWLTDGEEEMLLAASSKWLQQIILFALNTGFRQSEILDLTWKNINIAERTVYIGKQKNKGKDVLPLNANALAALQERAKIRHIKTNLVFYSQNGTRIIRRNLIRSFQVVLRKAGIEDFRFHDLRATFATRMAQAGKDPYKIQKLLRHKSPKMMQRYAHHYAESLRDAVEILDKKHDKNMTVAKS